MTETYTITDGTTSISLLNTSGFVPLVGGMGSTNYDASQLNLRNPVEYEKIVETYKLKLVSTSHDNAATQMQNLIKLLRKAEQYFSTTWQTTPVYLQVQTSGESNARYALVYGTDKLLIPDLYSKIFRGSNLLVDLGINIVREHPWRSGIPGTLPAASTLTATNGPANQTLVQVANYRDVTALSHIYNYDASLTTFSANLAGTGGITIWSVASATPAVEDYICFGADRPVRNIVIPLQAVGVYNASVVVEYAKGGASPTWVGLTEGSNVSTYPLGPLASIFKTETGDWVLNVNPGSDWALATINSVSKYWIRIRLSAVTSFTTTPISHGSYVVYNQRSPFIDIPTTATKGDAPSRFMLRMRTPSGGGTVPGMLNTSRIIIGAKSISVATFTSHFNCLAGALPSGWGISAGTDTSFITDPTAANGTSGSITFATTPSMTMRVQLRGTALMQAQCGLYRAYLIGGQTGGAAGDITAKIRTIVGGTAITNPMLDSIQTKTITLAQWQIMDMGYIHVPFTELVAADTTNTDLVYEIHAARASGTAVFKIDQLVLIPVDEWAVTLDDPLTTPTIGSSALRGSCVLDLDGGILQKRAIKYVRIGTIQYPAETWLQGGQAPYLNPATRYRLYFLMGHYTGGTFGISALAANPGMHLAVSVYQHDSFLSLRGSA